MTGRLYCAWYTVWDKKTGQLLCSGRPADVAKALGFKTTNSFYSSICHSQKKGNPRKYEILRERVSREEIS